MDDYSKDEIKRQEIRRADNRIADVRMDIRREDIRGELGQSPTATSVTTRLASSVVGMAAVPGQILTKSCLLGVWSDPSPLDQIYAFYADDTFYYEAWYTGNTCYIGTYTILTGSLLMKIHTNQVYNTVSKPISYIDQNTILIKSKIFKRVESRTFNKLINTTDCSEFIK